MPPPPLTGPAANAIRLPGGASNSASIHLTCKPQIAARKPARLFSAPARGNRRTDWSLTARLLPLLDTIAIGSQAEPCRRSSAKAEAIALTERPHRQYAKTPAHLVSAAAPALWPSKARICWEQA